MTVHRLSFHPSVVTSLFARYRAKSPESTWRSRQTKCSKPEGDIIRRMDQGVTEFVGRTVAQDQIRAALRDSFTGNARLVLVSGEAGIGKTALLTQVTREATGRDAMTVWGTCWDAERAPGYWPWAQVLRETVEQVGPDLLAAVSDEDRLYLSRLVPELHTGAPVITEEADSDRARFLFFDAVARWLERLARRRPLVVVFDDLQWADASSLELLDFVVRAYRPVPMLLLGAYRHDELRPGVADMFATVSAKADNVRLQGLSAAEVRDLLARTGDHDVAERWGEDVHGRTGGHPFLVRELAHELVMHESTHGVPAAAHDLIAGRVRRLAPECRRVLAAAAVVGNEVLPDVLREVLDLAAPVVVALLEDAVRAGVLMAAEDSPGRAKFAHDLYRETIYSDLPISERLSLHQQVGAALERRLARGGSVFAGEVARHFATAVLIDGPDRAIRWALEAATADRGRLAFSEAAGHIARLRAALDDAGVPVPGEALVDLLMAQADAESRAGDPNTARQLLRDAQKHAAGLDGPERLAAVALALQRLGARFAMPRNEVVALLEEARSSVAGRAPAIEAEVTASLARELHHSVPTDRARARPLSEHAVAIARDLDGPSTLAACLLARHDVLWTPGAATERAEVAREIVALAERVGDGERRSEGHLLTANALLESGSPAFRTELDAFLRLEEHFRQPRHDYLALTRRAAMALLDGSLDEGERLVDDAASLGERIGEPDAGNVRMSQLLEVARARGRPDQLQATAKMAINWWIGVPSHAHAVAAGLLAQAGDLDGARRALDTVLELGTWREDRSYLWSVFVGGLTVAAARLANLDLSRELLHDLTPLAGSCGVNGAIVCFVGSHAHWAGVAAKTLGQTNRARDLLLTALTVHQRLGARAWEAETCAELAELGGEGSPYRDRAAELADELGLVGLAARTRRADVANRTSMDAACYRAGDVWKIGYHGQSALIRDSKGLHDLAVLLGRPWEDVHVLDLAGSGIRGDESVSPILDARARADFRARIQDLEEDLAHAHADDDLGRIERVETEREALLNELRLATGRGKDRGLGPRAVDRARKAVTARIRDAIRRIEVAVPELGAHFDRSIVTGNYCRYEPAEDLVWNLRGPSDA